MKIPLKIIILCHKKDFYFTKICVASIRYYYSDVEIYIVKDLVNGFFSTKILEKYFDVKELKFLKDKFGNMAAKIHILLSKELKGQKFLVLDSDIVFTGKILEYLTDNIDKYDFIVSKETGLKPDNKEFAGSIYDVSWVKSVYPDFVYPGYYFNAGQMVVTPGLIRDSDLKLFFNRKHFPYWTDYGFDHLPVYDQNLLNFLLPLMEKHHRCRISKSSFMLWSEEKFVKNSISLDDIVNAKYPKLIHWARAHNSTCIKSLSRGDILRFFLYQYYLCIPLGRYKFFVHNLIDNMRYLASKIVS